MPPESITDRAETTAWVLLKLLINDYERCHTIDPLAHFISSGTLY